MDREAAKNAKKIKKTSPPDTDIPAKNSGFFRALRASAVNLLLASSFLFPLASQARQSTFTILFTNDHDGQLDPVALTDPSKPVGGVTRRMALIEKIRKEVGDDRLVLVDAGGLFPGTPLSELTRGEADCAAYQLMKYDAVAVAEHDFDYGQKTLLQYRKQFHIPWVSANLVRGGQPFLKPYYLKLAGGFRIGLIGFSNPDTREIVGRDKLSGLVFNPAGAAAKGLHSIFKKDADIFVALSRLGVEADKKLAKDNTFLHVIIGGYSKTVLNEPLVDKTKDGRLVGPIVAQAGSQGLYLGRLDVTVEGHRDPKTKKAEYSVVDYHYQLIPITSDLPEDPQMTELLQHYKDNLKTKPLGEVLASVSGDLTRSEAGDSLIGDITADAMRDASKSEVTLVHNGFFSGRFKDGDLTRERLYEVCPSEADIVVLDVPGAYLKMALEASADRKGQDSFLQVSGVKVQKGPEGVRITVGSETLNNRRKYLVAMDDFLAGGGGGYDFFRRLKSRRKTQIVIRDLLEDALKAKAKVAAAGLDQRWFLP